MLISLSLQIGNPAAPDITEPVELLVDSGATYSVVPRLILEGLGIKPIATEEFRIVDGTKICRQKGVALYRYGNRTGGADVIFGEEGDGQLLEAFTLEALGLFLHPLRRQLKPLPMVLMQSVLADRAPH